MTASRVVDQAAAPRSHPADELAQRLSAASVVRRDEPLARRTTLRVGGPAEVYVEPASDEDLAAVIQFSAERGLSYFVLGRGSNLLVRDGGVSGVVICLAHPHFSKVEANGSRMSCGAGARLKSVAVEARRHGVGGLEFLEGIPGTVGGALRMNAGAMGSATFDFVEVVRVMNPAGEIRELSREQVQADYRSCSLFKTHIALGAVFRGSPDDPDAIALRMTGLSERRWATQPAAPSAGCMFKNPAAIPAGRLIDELGLKGTRVGGAVVSNEHGNFIVNDGHATARDVLQLIELLRDQARSRRGIDLQVEVEIVGRDAG
jgi:UDP-N-acetylenolpyruvoylglucosamine reductase